MVAPFLCVNFLLEGLQHIKKYKKQSNNLFVWLKIVTFAAMNKKDKLIKRFKTQPRDFTFDEVLTLFQGCGFELENKGSTSGSRVKFYNPKDENSFIMHKPHPSNIIKGYMMRDILNFLLTNNYIK